jgi:glutaredoxin
MEVAYRLEEQDLHDVQVQLAELRRARRGARLARFLAAFAVSAAAGWPLWTAVHPGRPLLPLLRPFLAALVAAATIAAFLSGAAARRGSRRLGGWASRRLARAAARRSVLGNVAVAFTADGIVRRNDQGELRVARTELRDVVASPHLLTVRLRRGNRVIALPVRAFSDAGAFDAARARLETLAGAPATIVDAGAADAGRAGAAGRRGVRPELAAALAIAVVAIGVDRLAGRALDPRRSNPGGHVVLYGTAWCPACARLRACLSASGVPFDDRDVERSAEAASEWSALGGGGVPVTLVGSDAVFGFDRPALADRLETAGHAFHCAAGASAGSGSSVPRR